MWIKSGITGSLGRFRLESVTHVLTVDVGSGWKLEFYSQGTGLGSSPTTYSTEALAIAAFDALVMEPKNL